MIFEIILEIVLEGLTDAAGSPKVAKPVRYTIITGLYIFICGLFAFSAIFSMDQVAAKIFMWVLVILSTGFFIFIIRKIHKSNT